MKKINHDTAVLIFSKPVEREEKILVPDDQLKNTQSLRWLKKKTLALAEDSKLPSFLIETQQGVTFGDKLAHAFAQVFDKGFRHVIAIGSDCAELSSEDIREAARQVKERGSVLGPDKRNGVYLIGLSIDQFDALTFAELPWQSQNTLTALRSYLKKAAVLEDKQDLNNFRDFKRLIKNSRRRIRRLLYSFIKPVLNISIATVRTDIVHLPSITHRGPPPVLAVI